MITLIIIVGLYAVECIGSMCYPLAKTTFEAMFIGGLMEMIFEIPGVIAIYRKRDTHDHSDN